ncbi:hypothetical protein [Streptomyces zaomyceticus]|uniref:hypothetical protein n=1 Tax=Streptomyces zaomyceticus TaxID=68286 RepID=UPI0016764857|nr:hypothetical protein [Streptomyces zaomyceticus]GHG22206.1 hypothetical protein GCM10018791_41850 [Streptomyces zaomyceticus]
MRTVRMLAAAALTGAALLGLAAPAALADSPTATANPDDTRSTSGPTEAGTTFRTAARFLPGQQATAQAATGDYLYWVFPADVGQRPTVNATVTLPDAALRHGPAVWRVDVYDGLRRRQPCMYGTQSRTAAEETATVELACVLRPVRASADAWADDPLPGSYYVRLTVTSLPDDDLGQPFTARIGVSTVDKGGAYATDGSLAAPLVPGATTADQAEADADAGRPSAVEAAAPEDGWSSGWWSDRWLWTGAGGVLAALAGIGGYVLTRGTGRPPRVPPAA